MPLNEILAILMLVAFFVLLLAGIPVAVTLATAGLVFGYIGFGPLLFHLLAQSHLRRGHQLHPDRDAAVRVHGSDAGKIAAGRRFDGSDRPCRRKSARRPRHRHHPGRRTDGRHDRHRRRDRRHARPAHAADAAAAQVRQRPRVRNDLRLRHARPDHPAQPHPDPARRHPERVGRHAVRGGDDPRPDACRHLRRLPSRPRLLSSRRWSRQCRRTNATCISCDRARRQAAARGTAADRAGRRRARLDHRRRRRTDRGRLHGRARRHRRHRHRRAHVVGGAARYHLRDHPHHRDDDVHPDVRAGVLARLPRSAGRKTGAGLLRLPAGRHRAAPSGS